VRSVALLGTPLQILLTTACGYGIGRALDLPWNVSVWLGALFSVSSTMVVLKTLMARGRIARAENPRLDIVARAESYEQTRMLHGFGITEVVQPELEASLEVIRQALVHLGLGAEEIGRFTDAARRECYVPLHGEDMHPDLVPLQEAAARLAGVVGGPGR